MALPTPPLPDRAAIDAAARLVHGVLPATPQFAWPLLGAALDAEDLVGVAWHRRG